MVVFTICLTILTIQHFSFGENKTKSEYAFYLTPFLIILNYTKKNYINIYGLLYINVNEMQRRQRAKIINVSAYKIILTHVYIYPHRQELCNNLILISKCNFGNH